MHFEFQRAPDEGVLAGFAERSARGGEVAPIIVCEFLSSDDGERLLERLGKISDMLLSKAPPSPRELLESQIDHLVAIFHRDGRVQVWVNEPGLVVKAKTKRSVAAGEKVFFDDTADIAEFKFKDIEIPDEAGYIAIFSVGWRKGLAFDFRPLLHHGPGQPRQLAHALAGMYSYLLFRSRFLLSADEWDCLLAQGWFPFIALPTALIEEMIQHLRAGWPVDELLPKVLAATRASLPTLKTVMEASTLFQRHRIALSQALSAFERGEYAVAIHTLFSRIEGLLRDHHAARGQGEPNARVITETAGQVLQHHGFAY